MSRYEFGEYEPLPFEGHQLLITSCCRCGLQPLIIDPETALSVLIHRATGTPVDPDGNPARRGDPFVQREALCPGCIRLCQRAIAGGKLVSWPRPLADPPPAAEST
ncbi:hypothetical protein [Nonomuraea cavernae]|uniref:Uncharacterized protein n=1 Tax=Nonomuraea cavernae TaxID=2045107 RepID=A0A917ZDE1_9ACTN|nr:hypothetical protein [Nonomuraea cavernae]MCA2190638.1 hypothetical protein [Nonomuraea cavernae]GGO81275.1 hypothetical protein GCM10012289_69870 [Nonomuraea cavernae]